jgi:CO/xanthine dehydrogenase FAD-binding subunit
MIVTQPESLTLLLQELASASERPVLLAGGTDWIVEQHLKPAAASHVVDLSRVAELKTLDVSNEGIRIGAGVTYRKLIEDERTKPWPMLAEMAKLVGAWQIQARGTIGGNVATGSPAGDSLPVFQAYGAQVELASVRGTRLVPFAEFYTGYRRTVMAADEAITSLWLPKAAPGAVQMYRKVGTRRAQAISKVAFAGYADGDTIRLGMASVGPTVMALPKTCAALKNGTDPVAALNEDIKPLDDIRSTATYRMFVAENLIRGFAEAIAAKR